MSTEVQLAASNASLPTTIAAGRTPGTFSVGDSGGSSYSIPIWVPPGVGSDQLMLALAYSSRGSDGVMGVGWSLVGMSSITRCNRTWAQDGYRQGITLTTSDRLCLDGQQLKVVTGSPSNPTQGGTTFATEVESFSQIVAAGSSGSAPTSLTVTTKNGLIYDYGLTVDSQILAGPSGPIRTWALSQIRDRVGNKIKFSYYNDAESGSGYTDGSYRIKEIDYPYTASGQGPFYSVTFFYAARPSGANIPAGYKAGSLIQEPNELNTISIQNYGSSTPTKTYSLTYSTNSVSSRLQLTQVQECSATNCLPASKIGYESGSQGWSASVGTVGVTTSSQASPIAIDLNGDGLSDLLYPVTASGSTVHWWVTFSLGSAYGVPVDTGVTTPNFPVLITGAFSGKGQNQVLFPESGYWYALTCSTSSCTSANTNVPVSGEMFAADYDGDGLPDLVSAVGNSVLVRRNTTSPGGAVTFASTATTIWTASSAVTLAANNGGVFYAADYNADGRADILATTTLNTGFGIKVYWNVLLSNGFGTAPTVVQLQGSSSNYPLSGDWNGDGCTDIISAPTVYISNCAGGFTALSSPGAADAMIAIDWDGDGNTDLLYDNNGTWYVARSTGTGIAAGVSTGVSAPPTTSWFPLDVNGDGLIDLAYVSANAIYYRYHAGLGLPADLATSFTDGFAMNESPTYVPLSTTNYTKYSTATFPEQDYQGPLYVVSQFTASDGTGSTYQNQFWYYGARTQVQGRGFEGFSARRTYDTRNGLYTYNYDGLQFPWTGSLVERVVLQNNNSTYITSWQATPSSQVTGGSGFEQRVFPFFSATSESDYEYGSTLNGSTIDTISTTYSYGDGYGNPTQVATAITDTDPTSPYYTSVWQTVINNTYLNDSSSMWCLGLPTGVTVEQVVPGQTIQTRTYNFTPDSNHILCREQQQIVEPATAALTVTTSLGFDSCGNVNSVSVVGHNPDGTQMAPRTSSYNYSHFTSRCQLPEEVSNALNQSTTISYNYNFGAPLTVTDANGAPTTWSYDDFGRKNKETRPDSTYSTWGLSYCVNDPCFGVTGLRFLAARNEYDSTGKQYWAENRYFDGYDRVRYDESDHAFGTWTYDHVFIYDALGRLTHSYQPYSSASNGYWILSYDPLNRLTQASLYQGNGSLSKTLSFGFQGRTSTFTDPLTNVTTEITDVSGQLRQVRDPAPGGTTYFTYDAFGNMNQIKDTINAVSSATYNLRGFRTQLVDADAGTWTFSGDSLNELVSWTDMKNQSFGAAYDALGRLTSRSEPEGTSTWTWDIMPSVCPSGGKYVGQLTTESGYGYTETRCFDSISRLQTQIVTTDQAYQFDYSYNTVGAINTVTYPVSPPPTGTTAPRFEIQYAYSYGVPTQISDITQGTGVPLWTLSAANDYSSPTSESLGNSIVSIVSGYDPPTDNLNSIHSGVSGSTTNRQNLAYVWDADGNLHQRQDVNQGLTEVFTYDPLNRISSSTLNGQPNLSMSYVNTSGADQAGNIMQSGVGSYTYGDSHHPHGVTAAGAYTFTYDANGNVATRNGQSLSWASFNLPTSLQASVGGSTYSSAFSYGPDHQLFQQNATYSNGTETTEYAGSLMEKISGTDTGGVTAWRHYVPTPSGLAVIVSRNSNGSTTTAYALSDHLGSTDAVVSGSVGTSGSLLVQESFGPFGQRRQSNWAAGSPSSGDLAVIAETTRRGFTFQEELDNIGLIHMNGRVYDPTVGRFLSTDQAIGSLGDSQSVNPYSYVGNRPLSFVDPNGEDPATDIGEIVIEGGGPEDPYADVAALADLAFEALGLFGSAAPPPPPAAATPNASAQSGLSSTPCATPSPACGGGVQEVVVRTSRLFTEADVGKSLAGWGVVTAIGPGGVMADGTPYVQTVTITASRTNPTEILGAGAPAAVPDYNYRRVILGSFGLGALEYAPGYDLTNCAILATNGQFCGAGGLAKAVIGTAVPGEGGAAAKGGFAALSRAEEFGIKTYAQLRNALSGTGLQAHHLIENRFATLMGQTARQGLSVAVTPAEHQVFTNAWRAAIPYGAGTANATVEQVLNAARQIYSDYPSILSALGL